MRQSSLEAHEQIKPTKQEHYKIIKSTLKKIGKGTSKQIASKCSLTYHAVARRLSEMENKGIIKVVGRNYNEKCKPLIWEVI